MDWGRLAGPMANLGLDALAGIVGGPAGSAAQAIGRQIARELGVFPATPEAVEGALEDPASADVLRRYEAFHGDLLRALASQQHELAMVETRSESAFQSMWRPAMSWLLIVMWFWNAMALPVANALTGAGVVGVPYEQLLGFSGLWLTIYGGGHTLKSILGKA